MWLTLISGFHGVICIRILPETIRVELRWCSKRTLIPPIQAQRRYDREHSGMRLTHVAVTVNSICNEILQGEVFVEGRAAACSQLTLLRILRTAVVEYLSRQPCLMMRSTKVEKKTTQNQYCQISNRTKYTDNLVLDERIKENKSGISQQRIITEHGRTSGILKTVIS